MWIKNENEAVEKFYRAGIMDEPVEFSDNGKAQVTKKLGKKLIKEYGSIKPVKDKKTTKKSKKGDK